MSVTDMSLRATPNEAAPATDEPIASIVSLHQPKKPRKAKTDAERARACRERKKARALLSSLPVPAVTPVVPLEKCSTPIDRKGAISKILASAVTPLPPPGFTPISRACGCCRPPRSLKRPNKVAQRILDAYAEPDKSFVELRSMVKNHAIDLLHDFSKACRLEHERYRQF
jgi:hypothetical protein